MSTLKQAFLSLENHGLNSYKNAFKKVSRNKQDFQFCLDTIAKIDSLDFHKQIYTLNRLFVDKPDKTKNWLLIIDLLTTAAIRNHNG